VRILTIGNMYPPHHQGGYELVWKSWVDYARDRGHRLRVLTTDFRVEVDPGEPEDEGDVHRSLRWYWQDHAFPRPSLRERWAIERHNASVLETHLAEFDPEVVSWWAMGGMSLSLLGQVARRGLPAVAVVCDDWLLYGPRVDAWIRAFSRRPRLRRAVHRTTGAVTETAVGRVSSWVFPSQTLRARALDAWPDLARTEVIHQGPDQDLFRPQPTGPWSGRLLYVGRIDRRKGVDLAVRALARLPAQTTLTVIGSGDDAYGGELRGLVRELGLGDRVRFTRLPRHQLPGAYEACDAVLFPVRWAEPWGLVPLEAMAVGRPVVATGRGGSGEYLRDRDNCLLFDPDQGAGALAQVIAELAGDEELRERLRSRGFQTARSLSATDFNAGVLAAVESARHESRASPPGVAARLGA
jgi:glycogen(starch) synthase